MTKLKSTMTSVRSKRSKRRTTVTHKSIQSSAKRVTAQGSLVTPEIMYVQRQLGRTATEEEIDACVIAVRKLKWEDIMAGIE